jgi:hypothetical protein
MTDYKTIKGFSIQSVATDPLGEGAPNGVWSAGGNLNTGRQEMTGSGASQDSALAFGGDNGPGVVALTEAYNGTGWTEVADLNTARSLLGGTGLQGASLGIGGGTVNTELWNGSGWTEVNNLNTSKSNNSCAGITTAAISVGGGPDQQTQVELWDGTSWTETTEVNSAKNASASSGTSTATISAGGSPAGAVALTEIWNGSAWTEVADLNTARFQLNGFGLTTAALVFGGNTDTAMTANTEAWDGSAWAEVANFATATQTMGSSSNASNTNGASFGGVPNSVVTAEWTAGGIGDAIINEGDVYFNTATNLIRLSKKIFGTGAWASGANINSARSEFGGGAGTQSAFLIFGGQADPLAQLTESYDGSSWTEVADLNSDHYYSAGLGTQTAALCVAGNPGVQVNVESWDGSSWTEIANVNTGRWGLGSSKSSPYTSALVFGGKTSTADVANTETWNGTAWTEVNDLNTARRQVGSCGAAQTAALVMSGMPAPKVVVEQWNGTSWTEVSDLGAARYGGGGAGTTASALFIGGAPNSKANESWNGSAWTEVADTAQIHDVAASGGTALSGIVAGGRGTGQSAHFTEEWTVPESIGNISVDVD